MERVFASCVCWLSLVGLVALVGCGEDDTSESSSSSDAGMDVSQSATTGQDDVGEACDEKFSVLRFERQHPDVENRTTSHNRAISDVEASADTLGAEIANGRLTLYLSQRAEEDNLRNWVSLEPSMGNLTLGAFCVDDDANPDGRCDDDAVVLTSSEYYNAFTTSSIGDVVQGTLTLTTCPSAVGHRVIGTIEELRVKYGAGSDEVLLNTINGSFDVVVFASDGSITCAVQAQEEDNCQEQ